MGRISRLVLASLTALSVAVPGILDRATASPVPLPPELWVMDPDGSNQRRLYPPPEERSNVGWSLPSWSPDSAEIAFATHGEIRIADVIEGSTRVVSSFPAQDLAWSPDGNWIALASLDAPRGVYLIRPDGSDLHHIGPEAQVLRPVWAPDGSRLAVTIVTEPGEPFEVAVIDVGGGYTVLARDGQYTPVTWSPDGTRIAYVDRDGQLGIIDADGTVSKVTPPGPGRFEPTWSPEGSKIAFVEDGRLIAVNPDGSGRIELATAWTPPRWSPDAAHVAFTYSDDIFRVGRDAAGLTNLTNTDERLDHHPEWSPDGRMIAYLSGPKPYIPPDETYGTSVSLNARDHLVLRGRLRREDGTNYVPCNWERPPIVIEQRRPSGWERVARTRAGGELARFEVQISDREGRFRARVGTVVMYGIGGNKITCLAARSQAVVHRH